MVDIAFSFSAASLATSSGLQNLYDLLIIRGALKSLLLNSRTSARKGMKQHIGIALFAPKSWRLQMPWSAPKGFWCSLSGAMDPAPPSPPRPAAGLRVPGVVAKPAARPELPRETVAFLGLGALGTPMATNLLAAGFPLTVHNRNRQREEPLAALGARRAATPWEAATGSSLLCLCLSDDAAVRAVLLEGPDSASGGLAPGSLVIDFSTIAPASSEELAARLRERGVSYLDAPVTGGTEGAKAGTLSVLVGGSERDLKRARPLLEVVGARVSHFGPVGAGQRVKAVNQVLVAGSYVAVAEALALGQRFGLPMEQVCEALMDGAAGSWALRHRSANMLAGRFPLGFRLALHHKDLQIALEAAAATGLELPLSARVAAIEAELMAAGHGDEDVSALARWFAPQLEPPRRTRWLGAGRSGAAPGHLSAQGPASAAAARRGARAWLRPGPRGGPAGGAGFRGDRPRPQR